MKTFALLLSGLAFSFINTQTAVAAAGTAASNDVTISVSVLEHREIVIDVAGNITQISSNTPNDITPQVRLGSSSGKLQPLTPRLKREYRQLMTQTHGDGAMTLTPATPTVLPDLGLTHPAGDRLFKVVPARSSGNEPAAVPYYAWIVKADL